MSTPAPVESMQGVAGLVRLWKEDYATHDRDGTLPGFRAVAVHRFGNWRMQIGPKFARAPLSVVYRMAYRWVRNHYGIELPYSAVVGRRVRIEHQGNIVVHGSAVIGDDCIVRQGVTIGNRRLDEPSAAPIIGNRVNIGAGAVLLGGITIGDDVNIGANAVVLDDVPSRSLVVGPKASIRPDS